MRVGGSRSFICNAAAKVSRACLWITAGVLFSSSALAQDDASLRVQSGPLAPKPVALDATPPPATEKRTEPLLIGGLSVAALGAAGVTAGAVRIGTAKGDRLCGLTGCFNRPAPNQVLAGSLLVGGGVGALVVGAPAAAWGAAIDTLPADQRSSEGRMIAGLAFGAVGASLLGMGISAHRFYDSNHSVAGSWTPYAAYGVSSLAFAVGVPLFVTGIATRAGQVEASPDSEAPSDGLAPPPKRGVSGLTIAGIVLLGGATVAVATGGGLLAAMGAKGEGGQVYGYAGFAAFGVGGTMVLAGIPCLIVGLSRTPSKRAREQHRQPPSVDASFRVGPGSFTVMGSF
jgi:hypothetical protein